MTKRNAVDGFVPRRSPGVIGEAHTSGERKLPRPDIANGLQRRVSVQHQKMPTHITRPAHEGNGLVPTGSEQHGLTRADIDDSLNQIDADASHAKSKPVKHKRGSFKSQRKRVVKSVLIFLVLVGLIVGGWVGVKALIASKAVFKGDIFGLIQQKKLQQDANGRTNVLIVGTSEDDPGHEAGHLTDSIMVLSIDQTNKNAYMISVPRDLRVQYGMACTPGYAGKINVFFGCVNDDWSSDAAETERQAETRKFIGNILGLELQYSVHVNYTVMRDVVKAIGGITVTIESRDPRGQMDSNFDWKCKGGNAWASRATMIKNCPPSGHFIDYPNGPVELDAEHALYLAQARGDIAPTYGFEQSNFDREKNQQKIIVAIKEKSMSTGTLTNLSKVTGLIDALGGNLRTNFDTSEIRTLMSLGQDIQSSAIQSVSLVDAQPALFGSSGGDVIPAAGAYNYTSIQAYIKKKILATGISKEDAHVIVLNASGVAGAAQIESDKLTALGMTVDAIGNAPAAINAKENTIYQVSKTAKAKTVEKLSKLYSATPKVVTSVSGVTIGEDTDYVIILVEANTSATGNTTTQ